jgi:hypothetical protein
MFLGTISNGVRTKICTALTATLIFPYLQLTSTFGLSLSNQMSMLKHQFFVYHDLIGWLNALVEVSPQFANAGKPPLLRGISPWLDSSLSKAHEIKEHAAVEFNAGLKCETPVSFLGNLNPVAPLSDP